MKKALFLLLILAFAGTAFADYSEKATVTLGSGINSLTVKLSNQVKLDYAQKGGGDTFVIAAYHDKGTRTFMSSSEDASIYYGEETKIKMPNAPEVGTSIGVTTVFDKTL